MESHFQGARIDVPNFDALLNAPQPRYWFGQRMKLGRGFATIIGLEWCGCGSGNYSVNGMDAGWYYSIELDVEHPSFRIEPVQSFHEGRLHPVDSAVDVSTKVIHRPQYCSTP